MTDWRFAGKTVLVTGAGTGFSAAIAVREDVGRHNAGDMASEQMSWRDITEESIDHTLAVDIKGTLMCTHELGSRMLEQEGGGSIVSIAHAFAPRVRVTSSLPGSWRPNGCSTGRTTGSYLAADGGYNMIGA